MAYGCWSKGGRSLKWLRLWRESSHTIGDWLSSFRRAGAQGMVFEHTGGSPPP